MDNAFHLDSRWRLSQQTTSIFGYRYSQADYTGDADLDLLGTFQSEDRNSRSHYIYGGLEHEFTPDLSGSIKAGAILTDYYNDDSPNASSAEWDPYVSAGLNWTMRPGTSLGVGVNVDNSAANSGVSGGELVRDTQTTVLYAKLAHQILAQLFSDFSATWQHAVYNGGGTGTDGKGVDYLLLSANLQYRFNRNFSTSLGYSFDNVTDSRAEGIDYSRNRIYFGVTATY